MTDPNLTIYNDLVQGSQEWLDARAGLVTASTIGKLLTPTLKVADNDTSRGLIATLAAERITGTVEYSYPGRDQQRGSEYEPFGRGEYEKHFSPVTEIGFMEREYNGVRIGFSPDGLIANDGLIEIKGRRAKVHLTTILTGTVPRENMAQIQCGLMVSEREWCDYVSYCPGLPLFVKRVTPDATWAIVLRDAAFNAEADITEIVEQYKRLSAGLHPTDKIPELEDIII